MMYGHDLVIHIFILPTFEFVDFAITLAGSEKAGRRLQLELAYLVNAFEEWPEAVRSIFYFAGGHSITKNYTFVYRRCSGRRSDPYPIKESCISGRVDKSLDYLIRKFQEG